jgi:hypothetical protein
MRLSRIDQHIKDEPCAKQRALLGVSSSRFSSVSRENRSTVPFWIVLPLVDLLSRFIDLDLHQTECRAWCRVFHPGINNKTCGLLHHQDSLESSESTTKLGVNTLIKIIYKNSNMHIHLVAKHDSMGCAGRHACHAAVLKQTDPVLVLVLDFQFFKIFVKYFFSKNFTDSTGLRRNGRCCCLVAKLTRLTTK